MGLEDRYGGVIDKLYDDFVVQGISLSRFEAPLHSFDIGDIAQVEVSHVLLAK